mmetsp:Transcript_25704/g.83027  ORF Transcript_25704/g.83027 Transcript_25704/m.83027 type:complete len:211 (+) Transcript_25704:789-1421(+)
MRSGRSRPSPPVLRRSRPRRPPSLPLPAPPPRPGPPAHPRPRKWRERWILARRRRRRGVWRRARLGLGRRQSCPSWVSPASSAPSSPCGRGARLPPTATLTLPPSCASCPKTRPVSSVTLATRCRRRRSRRSCWRPNARCSRPTRPPPPASSAASPPSADSACSGCSWGHARTRPPPLCCGGRAEGPMRRRSGRPQESAESSYDCRKLQL